MAERVLRHALLDAPGCAEAHLALARHMVFSNHAVAALAHIKRAVAIAGLTPAIALDRATNYTGWHSDDLGAAVFSFLAQKAGSTTISFEGHIHYRKGILEHFSFSQRNDLVSDSLAVTVQDCAYRVSVFSTWTEPSRKDVASISDAPLTQDAPGHYTGSGQVNWKFGPGAVVAKY